MRDILIEFRDNMKNRGTISQNDILSLETMIQENIITDQKSINYFTKDSTQVGVQEVNEILDKKINESDAGTKMTTTEFLDLSRQTVDRLKSFKEFIFTNIVGLSSEIIDFLNNPKYEKMYVVNNSTKVNEIVNIKDELLYDLFMYNNPFKTKFYETFNISEDKHELFVKALEQNQITREDTQYIPVFSELMSETVEPLTFNLLLKIKDMIGDVEKSLNNDLEFYRDYDNYDKVERFMTGDYSWLKEQVSKLNTDNDKYNTRTKAFIFLSALLELISDEKN